MVAIPRIAIYPSGQRPVLLVAALPGFEKTDWPGKLLHTFGCKSIKTKKLTALFESGGWRSGTMEASIKKDFLLILTGFPGKPGMTAAEGHLSGRTKSG
jgi:hypothetical protein